MEKILFVLLLSVANISYAGMDRQGNPILDPEAPPIQSEHSRAVDEDRDSAGINLLNEVFRLIRNNYYKNIDFNTCIPALLKGGITECTDRYSYYLDPVQATEEKNNFISGELAGIGASLEINKDGGVKVLDVFEGSPAEKAGLLQNDIIVAVSSVTNPTDNDWTDIGSMPLEEAVKIIKGPKGTSISLIIISGEKRKILTIIRGIVKIPFLKSKMIGEKIGYVKINAFGGEVFEQLRDSMENLDKSGAKSVIIDLRNNGGGKLNSAINMCALFSKKGKMAATILYVKGRKGPMKDVTAYGLFIGKFKEKKIVVLQNGNSASASEILSGYLKHETDAVIVGEKSFGKGIVQSLIPLSNRGELHLTISEYFIGGNMIKVHGVGISPTIEVKMEKPAKTEKEDVQLQRAILEAEKLVK